MRHGFLLVDKPLGKTSHDIVGDVRRVLGERSIGHLGTLDPAASGLLVLAVGKKALRVVELFGDLTKEYEAQVTLGKISSTYDREGVIETPPPRPGWEIPEQATVQRTIADHFVGRISQVPPAYSAVKVNGERAYKLARDGEEVTIAAREVEISACQVLKYEYPNLSLRVACGSGTYIRSLAHDLGKLLWCGGYLAGLRRTKVGDWKVEDAVKPAEATWGKVMPLKDVLKDFPRRDLSNEEWDDIQHGRHIEADVQPDTIGWKDDLPVAVLAPVAEGVAKGRKVFGARDDEKKPNPKIDLNEEIGI